MDPTIIPHISARVDVLDKGEGTYSGQGIAGDIPHGLGSWKAHSDLWFAGEWDHGVPVRGVYCPPAPNLDNTSFVLQMPKPLQVLRRRLGRLWRVLPRPQPQGLGCSLHSRPQHGALVWWSAAACVQPAALAPQFCLLAGHGAARH